MDITLYLLDLHEKSKNKKNVFFHALSLCGQTFSPAQVSIITILFIIIVIIMTNSIIIPIVTISIEIVPKYIQYLMQHNQVDTSLSIL